MSTVDSLRALAWPLEQAGGAIATLAKALGLSRRTGEVPQLRLGLNDWELEKWVHQCGDYLGVEIVVAETDYADTWSSLSKIGPSILLLGSPCDQCLLVVLRSGPRGLCVLTPSGKLRRVSLACVEAALRRRIESDHQEAFESVFATIGITDHPVAQRRFREEWVGTHRVGGMWLLRPAPSTDLRTAAMWLGLHWTLAWVLLGHALQHGLWIVSWATIGAAVLQPTLDSGWLVAWALVLATIVPLRAAVTYGVGVVSTRLGGLVKTRVLAAALELDTDQLRGEGIGHQLGRVIESDLLARSIISGGFPALFATMELMVATLVMVSGGVLATLLTLLLAFVGVSIWLTHVYARGRSDWVRLRVTATHGLVERLVGHPTRLVQEAGAALHGAEDEELARYAEVSAKMDGLLVRVTTLPRAWLVVGLAGLLPSIAAGELGTEELALSLGGILLAYRALMQMSHAAMGLVNAEIAFANMKQLQAALRRRPRLCSPELAMRPSRSSASSLRVVDLSFQHQGRSKPTLRGCELELAPGARVLLEGASGSGKSTFGAIVAGLRTPGGGTVLIDGFDRETLGENGWRERVVCAPQFHENLLFTAPFAVNLLMGRRWPYRDEDLAEAESLCRSLGLGPLLDRMPDGLQQMLGETGWQLSQGERCRVFLARALLQNAGVIILDESLAALDPPTMASAVAVLEEHPATLLVIAHP